MKRADKPVAKATTGKFRSTEGDDTTIHLRLTPEDRRRLRAILGFMLGDPEFDRNERLSFAGAVRYSMRLCVASPPAHVVKAPGAA